MRRTILFFTIASVIVALCRADGADASNSQNAPSAPVVANVTTTKTEAPTTEAPTTKAPTTEAPTTKAPTTEAPTTEAPTTKAPETTTKRGPPGIMEEGGPCESIFMTGSPASFSMCKRSCWFEAMGNCNYGLKCCPY